MFEKTFLLTNTSIEIVLGMLFLSLSNANLEFVEPENLIWRIYITAKIIIITRQVEFINNRDFIKVVLDENFETFMINVTTLKDSTKSAAITIYLYLVAQIAIPQYKNNTSNNIFSKYSNFDNVF